MLNNYSEPFRAKIPEKDHWSIDSRPMNSEIELKRKT